ncbi:hypothetical protein C0J50_21098, partial [Silurus asotus]
FHLRYIAKQRNMLSISNTEKLIHAFMTFRLDYCNASLGGCPASLINKLHMVQNAAARVLTSSRKYDHITPILSSLHWLPVKLLVVHRIAKFTRGGKTFSHLVPKLWNNLPVRGSDTLSQFKCRLKTYLFSKS